jgi:3-oxoacyl-[acyl-carrier protein] reductase
MSGGPFPQAPGMGDPQVGAGLALSGRVALVTGGARGIGRACAEKLSQDGASVVVVDRLGQEAEASARTINNSGGRAVALSADLAQVGEIVRVVEQAVRVFGGIDALVNNAGITSETSTEELTEEHWDHVMAINLKTVFFVSQAVLPIMVRRGGGAIVNISSMAARNGGVVSDVAYAASKTGVIGITRTLARQYGTKGIRVNAVAPSPILTEMISHWSEKMRNDFVSRIPLGRLGSVDDVAKVVAFLAGPAACYLTGITIDVTGGLFMG